MTELPTSEPTIFQRRLEELGWTEYRLAKEILSLRGQAMPVRNYAKTIKRLLENPDRTELRTVQDAVQVMGGKIVVEFPHRLPR